MKFKESETIELKKSTSELKEAVISIVAILNKHQKGEIYFGIKNDGSIIGQDISEKTIRGISITISEHIEPKIYPKINQIKINNKKCVRVQFYGKNIPYFAYGRAYMRVGDENRQISAKELEKLFLRNKILWEMETSDKTIRDIDVKILRNYILRANNAKRINFQYINVKTTLKKLNLLKNGKLLKAAEILFCKSNPIEVQAAVFASKEKITFLDIKQFKGNIFNLIEQSEEYIKGHIDWRAVLKDRTRDEIPEVPLRAITEALVNSLCHRDYWAPESNKVAIFKDRVEIYNPGTFPEGLTPEDYIYKEEQSVLRNPLIADVLYKSRDIEKWGSGLKRIYQECKAQNVKVEFKILKTGFMIVFFRTEIEKKTKVTERVPENVPENVPEKRTKVIFKYISKNNKISTKNLSEILQVSEKTVKRDIEKLKEKKLLKRIGADKGGYWKVLKKY